MGRIAEALKRAQQERTRLLDSEVGRATTQAGPVWSGSHQETGQLILETEEVATTTTPGHRPEVKVPVPPLPFSASPILPEAVDPRFVAFHEPTSEIAEKYRSVRTRLLTGNPGGSARSYAVTSALRQEGRTVTVGNLGFCLAELRHLRVAIVDLDFRNRGLTRMFGLQDQPGIADVLRGEKNLADVCVPVVRGNLHLIPAGDLQESSPSDLLAGEHASEVFKEIAKRFHYTLIDTPPVHKYADIGLIAPFCQSVLIVIRMNRTPEPLLRRSVKMLQANHLSIAGCILAGCPDQALNAGSDQDYYMGGVL